MCRAHRIVIHKTLTLSMYQPCHLSLRARIISHYGNGATHYQTWKFHPPARSLFHRVIKSTMCSISVGWRPRVLLRSIHAIFPCIFLVSWWRNGIERFPYNWPFVKGVQRPKVDSPDKVPIMCSFNVSFVVSLNKLLNNQSLMIWYVMTPLWCDPFKKKQNSLKPRI